MTNTYDISGLMKYASRDEWQEHLNDVLEEHVSPAVARFNIDENQLADMLDEHWLTVIGGIAFEDLATRFVDPDQLNIVDVFLKHRGWKEKTQNKLYLRALRDSVMSLYEISNVTPGKSMQMRDLIRGGDPQMVSEHSATRTLKQWDKLAARIVHVGEKTVLGGGALPFTPDAAQMAMETIEAAARRHNTKLDDEMLRDMAPAFTNAWLTDVLSKLSEEEPSYFNAEGDEVVFHTLRFPIAKGVLQKAIAARMCKVSSLRRESSSFWNWLAQPDSRKAVSKATHGIELNVTTDDGAMVLGTIDMKGRFLALMVNSASRATEGRHLLETTLGDLIGEPVIEIQTVEAMRASQPQGAPRKEIPSAIAIPLLHEMMDKQYRAILDESVGMLGDMSPRAAIRTEKGRQRVAEWIKYLENNTAKQGDPAMANYDFGWMWRELNIEKLRK